MESTATSQRLHEKACPRASADSVDQDCTCRLEDPALATIPEGGEWDVEVPAPRFRTDAALSILHLQETMVRDRRTTIVERHCPEHGIVNRTMTGTFGPHDEGPGTTYGHCTQQHVDQKGNLCWEPYLYVVYGGVTKTREFMIEFPPEDRSWDYDDYDYD